MMWRTFQVSGFTVHLNYKTSPMPRRRDFLLIEYTMSKGASKEELLNMSRVSALLCALFVSDIVMADGKRPERICYSQNIEQGTCIQVQTPKGGTHTRRLYTVGDIMETTHRWKF